jgi:hypothetical protein
LLCRGQFHQKFLPSKKLLAHDVWHKFNQHCSEDKIRSKLAKICTPFAKCRLPKKGIESFCSNFSRTNVDEIDPRSEDCVKVNSIACRRTTPPSHFRAITYNPNTSEMSANFFKNFSSKIPFTFSPKKSVKYKKVYCYFTSFFKISNCL